MTENIHQGGDADNPLTDYGRRLLAHRKHNEGWTYKKLRAEMDVSNNTIAKWGDKYANISEEEVESGSKPDAPSKGGNKNAQDTSNSDIQPQEVDKLEMKVEDTRKQKNDSKGGKQSMTDEDDDYVELNPNSKKQIKFFASKWSTTAKKAQKGIKKLKKNGMSQVDIENNDVI